MKQAILDLISSKRSLIILFTALADILILFGLGISPELATHLATIVSSLGGLLVAAYSYKETGSKRDAELSWMNGIDPQDFQDAVAAMQAIKDASAAQDED